MSEVMLTRNQSEAIESLESEKWEIVQTHIDEGWTHPKYKCLNLLGNDEFIKALYIGYEIKEEFKVGDWVVTEDGMAAEIIDVCMFHNDSVALYGVDGRHTIDTLRHATPEEIAEEKERRWWAKYGRQIDEIRPNDVLINVDDTYFNARIVESVHEKGNVKFKGNEGYSPSDLIKKSYKVVCFAKDRKDE